MKWDKNDFSELPTLTDFAENSLKIYQPFYVLMNKIEKLPYYGNFSPIFKLNAILIISLIDAQNLPDCKLQILAALIKV